MNQQSVAGAAAVGDVTQPYLDSTPRSHAQHWFQSRIRKSIQDGGRRCAASQECPACLDTNHTLVVAMWRNPYDWVTAMSHYPHHAKARGREARRSSRPAGRRQGQRGDDLRASGRASAASSRATDGQPAPAFLLPVEAEHVAGRT